MAAPVQLSVDLGPVGQRPALGQLGGEGREKRRFQLVFADALGQRPADPGTVSAHHVLENSGAPGPGAAGNLTDTEPRGFQPQDFADLSHR
jgi:hypothetical protein